MNKGFNTRFKVLSHIASRYPSWVGVDEIINISGSTKRTARRFLRDMQDMGLISSDDHNPKGYKLNPEKFRNFVTEVRIKQ